MTLDELADIAARLVTALDDAARSDVTAGALEGVDIDELGIDAAAATWISLGYKRVEGIVPDPDYLDHYNLGRELARRFARPTEGRA